MNGLEAFKKISEHHESLGIETDELGRTVSCGHAYIYEMYPKECKAVENELKLLELIKRKKIDISLVVRLVDEDEETDAQEYNEWLQPYKEELTEQEFDLIRIWLGGK